MRKSQTPPKSELRQAQKRGVPNPSTQVRNVLFETVKREKTKLETVRNPSTRVRNVLFETVKREGESSAVAVQKT